MLWNAFRTLRENSGAITNNPQDNLESSALFLGSFDTAFMCGYRRRFVQLRRRYGLIADVALYRRIGSRNTAPPRLNGERRERDRSSDVFTAELVNQYHATGQLIESLDNNRPNRKVD